MPPSTKEEILLKEIRDLLRQQQTILDEMRTSMGIGKIFPHVHWKFLAFLALFTLGIGSFGAYQYYKILQSIIDQIPMS